MIPAPRVNVVQVPPPAPHILAPRPPPVVVPAGKLSPWIGILLKLFQLKWGWGGHTFLNKKFNI